MGEVNKIENKRPSVKSKKQGNIIESKVSNWSNIQEHFGINDDDTFKKMMTSLSMFCEADLGSSDLDTNINSCLELVSNLRPKDLLEKELIIQIIMTHQLFEKCSTIANIKGQNPDRVDSHIKNMTKLSRLFLDQIKALTRYRNNGQQKVKVEHVHMSEGSQAVFGDVTHKRGGV